MPWQAHLWLDFCPGWQSFVFEAQPSYGHAQMHEVVVTMHLNCPALHLMTTAQRFLMGVIWVAPGRRG
jgi:hypothetical protein